ncbi:MAG: serine protease [Nitrospinota bacterium]
MVKRRINPVLMSIVRLKLVQDEKDIGTATGFFFAREGRIYLITNRHVAKSLKREIQPTHFRVHLHRGADDLGKNVWIPIPLFDEDGRPRWLESRVTDSDILCLEVEEIRRRAAEKAVAISALSEADFVPDDLDFELGQELLVIGYPRGYHDEVHNLPVIRYATLASPYPIPFQGKPLALIDATLHPGTSGSPVILKPSSIPSMSRGAKSSSRRRVYLIGVHSSSVGAVLKDGGKDPLGLHLIWFANLIPDIIAGRA